MPWGGFLLEGLGTRASRPFCSKGRKGIHAAGKATGNRHSPTRSDTSAHHTEIYHERGREPQVQRHQYSILGCLPSVRTRKGSPFNPALARTIPRETRVRDHEPLMAWATQDPLRLPAVHVVGTEAANLGLFSELLYGGSQTQVRRGSCSARGPRSSATFPCPLRIAHCPCMILLGIEPSPFVMNSPM